MKNKAFTLAEVLITLVIIGVIAAITVPSIIQSTHKLEYVTKLKKVYSTLTQATDMIMFEEGNAKASTGGWAKDVDAVYEQYKKHLSLTKDCGSGAGCFSQGELKRLDGRPDGNVWDTMGIFRKVILSDGTQIMFEFNDTACEKPHGTGSINECAVIYADVNGEQKPNTLGRDVFQFVLKNEGLYPGGVDDSDGEFCAKKSYGGGWSCTLRVLTENAMNY